MIKGIGNDIIETLRIENAYEAHGSLFLSKLFTSSEIDYCLDRADTVQRLSGRFAAKEAVAKALGVGFGNMLSWHDFEIINDQKGKPQVVFFEKAKQTFENPKVLLSISHCKNYASAVAIWEG